MIEFAASLPEKLQVARTDHQIFVEANAEKTVAGGKSDRRKMGFGVPIGHWFRGKLQPFLRETCFPRSSFEARICSSRRQSNDWSSCTRAASAIIHISSGRC